VVLLPLDVPLEVPSELLPEAPSDPLLLVPSVLPELPIELVLLPVLPVLPVVLPLVELCAMAAVARAPAAMAVATALKRCFWFIAISCVVRCVRTSLPHAKCDWRSMRPVRRRSD
jgi:hypothetical protein